MHIDIFCKLRLLFSRITVCTPERTAISVLCVKKSFETPRICAAQQAAPVGRGSRVPLTLTCYCTHTSPVDKPLSEVTLPTSTGQGWGLEDEGGARYNTKKPCNMLL